MPNERAQGTVVSFPGSANSIQFTSSEVYSLPSLFARWERQHLLGLGKQWEASGRHSSPSLLSRWRALRFLLPFGEGEGVGVRCFLSTPHSPSELSRHE